MNPDVVTIQDYLENYSMRGKGVILSNGKVEGFVREENRKGKKICAGKKTTR